jgi:hypothetical protein
VVELWCFAGDLLVKRGGLQRVFVVKGASLLAIRVLVWWILWWWRFGH